MQSSLLADCPNSRRSTCDSNILDSLSSRRARTGASSWIASMFGDLAEEWKQLSDWPANSHRNDSNESQPTTLRVHNVQQWRMEETRQLLPGDVGRMVGESN
jgi:hypothetical protein